LGTGAIRNTKLKTGQAAAQRNFGLKPVSVDRPTPQTDEHCPPRQHSFPGKLAMRGHMLVRCTD